MAGLLDIAAALIIARVIFRYRLSTPSDVPCSRKFTGPSDRHLASKTCLYGAGGAPQCTKFLVFGFGVALFYAADRFFNFGVVTFIQVLLFIPLFLHTFVAGFLAASGFAAVFIIIRVI